MFDFHLHSLVSFDGRDDARSMAQAAADRGLKEICFTDHVEDDPRGVTKDQFSIEEYNATYNDLHIPGLTIRKGLEFGMLENNQPLLKWYLAQRHFDFVIASIHFVDDWDIYYPEYWAGKSQDCAEQRYFETMLACVKNHEDFDVLGHLTYISKPMANPTKRLIPYAQFGDLTDEILKALVSKGKGMEINTSGLDRCGDFLPGEEYLRRFKELGGEIVTVGSDSHGADNVGRYCDRAIAMAKDIFGYVCTFEDRKPVFHKL